jgi:hypothetical protein
VQLPRPLLVLVVVLIVLAVAACGLSLGKRDEPAGDAAGARGDPLVKALKEFAPGSAPLQLTPSMATCLDSGQLKPNPSCDINVQPENIEGPRRRLQLKMSTGTMRMTVSGVSGQETIEPTSQTVTNATEDASLVLMEGDTAEIELQCLFGPCIVNVNPTPPP